MYSLWLTVITRLVRLAVLRKSLFHAWDLVHKLTFRMIQIVSLGNLEVLYSLLVPNGALVMRLSQADQTTRDKGYLLASDFAPALALFILWEPIGHLFPHLLCQQMTFPKSSLKDYSHTA